LGAGGYSDTAFAAAGAGRGWRSPRASALLLRIFLIATFGVTALTFASITLRSDLAVNPHSALVWDAVWYLSQLVEGLVALAVVQNVIPYRQWRVSQQAAAAGQV
jgi:cell division protein FtsW (lipid II flippase)